MSSYQKKTKRKTRTQLKGIERHLYAPELNRLIFDDGSHFKVAGERDLEEAWAMYEKVWDRYEISTI